MIDVFVLCYYQPFAYPFIRLIFSENMKSATKPEETLVEVRSDSDVQIDRQTWV